VTEQYDLLTTPPHLYDMLGIDDKYDAAFEGFVRKAHAQAQPFFFYFCSHHTHAPQFAPDDFRGYSVRGLQGDSLGLIDRSAGRMMNLTKELGIDENTLIVMSADNGGSLTWRELGGVNGDLRCGKGTTYEGGHRVPLIARWPVSPLRSLPLRPSSFLTGRFCVAGQDRRRCRHQRADVITGLVSHDHEPRWRGAPFRSQD
jgi:arylsulfatase A